MHNALYIRLQTEKVVTVSGKMYICSVTDKTAFKIGKVNT